MLRKSLGNGIEWDLSRENSFFRALFCWDVTNETSWILVGLSGIQPTKIVIEWVLVGLDSTNQNGDLMGSSGI